MTEQRVSYTLDSTLETVDSAEQAASRIATEAGFDDDEVMRIAIPEKRSALILSGLVVILSSPSGTRAKAWIRTRFPIPWRRKIF